MKHGGLEDDASARLQVLFQVGHDRAERSTRRKGSPGPAQAGFARAARRRLRPRREGRPRVSCGRRRRASPATRCASRSRKFWWLSTCRQAIRCTMPGFSWSRYQLIRFSGSSRSISILAARSRRWTSAAATVMPRTSAGSGLRTALRRGGGALPTSLAEIVEPHVAHDCRDRDRLVLTRPACWAGLSARPGAAR